MNPQIDNITQQATENGELLKRSIDHVFESGANEWRIFELVENFIKRGITLALEHKPKAGISVEEAQELAAKELGYLGWHSAMSITNRQKAELRTIEIYAQSAVEAYRQRVEKALPTKSEVEKEINSRIWRISDYDQWFKDNVKQYSEQMAKWAIERIQSILNTQWKLRN